MAELYGLSLKNDANLQGYWRLENVNDSGPNGYTLTNNNTVTFAAGKWNNGSNHVAASSQYLTSTAAGLRIIGNQTWACWFKPNSPAATQYLMEVNGGGGQIGIYITAAGGVSFVALGISTPADQVVNSSVEYNDGVWNFAAGRFTSGSEIAVFVNGTWTKLSSTGSPTAPTTNFGIGASGAGANYLNGMVDDGAIFNRALTDAEVLSIYQSGGSGNFFNFF
jgi:hypothetical protein